MIAAAKLGAGRLGGVDKDEAALGIAAENLKLNRVSPQIFYLAAGNLGAQINESYNFIVANIYSHVILKLLNDIPRLLTAGGIFVCSGIIQENKNSVLAAMDDLAFEILETAVKEDWVAIAGRLPAESRAITAQGARQKAQGAGPKKNVIEPKN
jgi:ribosomal protein L11 methyltransferase